MKKIFHALLLCCLMGGLAACNTQSVSNESQANQETPPAAANTPPDTAQKSVTAPEALNSSEAGTLMDQWNNAINQKDYTALAKFYGEDVNYDGKVVGPGDVVLSKKNEAQNQHITHQQLRDVVVAAPNDNVRQLDFIKQVIMDGKTKEYGVTMLLEAENGIWKIVAEKNTPKDLVIAEATPRHIAESDIKSCKQAAMAIFLSAPEVQDLLSDPQVQYKLEYSPEDVGNPNHRYWFWVYMPHTGNTETYGRFQVDPSNGRLYEYNAVSDDIKPMEYDQKLSKYMKQYCGK